MTKSKSAVFFFLSVSCSIIGRRYSLGFLHAKASIRPCQRSNNYNRLRNDAQRGVADPIAAHQLNNTTTTFIRTYPRYQIDLTRERDIVDERPRIQWPWQTLLRKNDGSTSYPQVTSSVTTMTTLWQTLANVSDSAENTKGCITFPNAPIKTVRQWVDLVDWMQQNNLTTVEASFCPETNGVHLIQQSTSPPYPPESNIPDHSIVTQRTKAWVQRVLVDMGICPFTKSVTRSGHGLADMGVPVAKIAYHTSSSTTLVSLLADTWQAMEAMLEAGPTRVSSILLAAPYFDDNFPLWAGPFFTLLETSVVVAMATNELGVVCFHPAYQTSDGSSWPGFGHMHSVLRLLSFCGRDPEDAEAVAEGGAWQRRTPHATVNVLRADQLAVAEGKRATPELYAENIEKLLAIADELPGALEREQNMK